MSFAMESIRKNLVWRLSNLWPLVHSAPTPLSMIHCLPESVHDPFGRPIILLKPLPISVNFEDAKPIVIETFERLRRHLQDLNKTSTTAPILQYMILLDIKEFSLKYFDLDLFTWILREIIPKFSGMLGGVEITIYIFFAMTYEPRRVLPESALSRVFFFSDDDLMHYFTPESLPEGQNGSLL
ncbi:hypothetical protein C0991_004689 [Blastosporella zonata]|nr:hypothetical protein C0991_004689 [Blastosporella zonata]